MSSPVFGCPQALPCVLFALLCLPTLASLPRGKREIGGEEGRYTERGREGHAIERERERGLRWTYRNRVHKKVSTQKKRTHTFSCEDSVTQNSLTAAGNSLRSCLLIIEHPKRTSPFLLHCTYTILKPHTDGETSAPLPYCSILQHCTPFGLREMLKLAVKFMSFS